MPASQTTVLVTGFEPFDGQTVNPSQQAVARLVDAPVPDGVRIRTAVLPVEFGAAGDALRTAIATHDPGLVICTGEAGGRFGVTPERVAVNVADARVPDNAGRTPVDEPVVAGGPVAYFSGLPVAAIVDALRAAGIPADESWTAGTYVCNSVFYALMHLIATERPGLVGGFVHVPYVPEQVVDRGDQPSLSLDLVSEGLQITVRTSVAALTTGR